MSEDRVKRVYIAGPISKGDLLKNIRQFDAAFVKLLSLGFSPFNPGASVYLGNSMRDKSFVLARADSKAGGVTHEEWMRIDLAWLECADMVLRLPGESVGADIEVEFAKEIGIPVFENIDDLPKQPKWERELLICEDSLFED